MRTRISYQIISLDQYGDIIDIEYRFKRLSKATHIKAENLLNEPHIYRVDIEKVLTLTDNTNDWEYDKEYENIITYQKETK